MTSIEQSKPGSDHSVGGGNINNQEKDNIRGTSDYQIYRHGL